MRKIVFPQESNLQPLDYRSTALPLELEQTPPRMLNFGYLNQFFALLLLSSRRSGGSSLASGGSGGSYNPFFALLLLSSRRSGGSSLGFRAGSL